MATVSATPISSQLNTLPSAPIQHSYGTRIRSNSVIRPSARLRQSPDPPVPPRRIKPVPNTKSKTLAIATEASPVDLPPFPPPHVMLHSDDANSKVFLAIGRSFMSVNNCAMTIKDLADMTMQFGLMCQNVSAAGQAITTYIRNHMQRCETQQDHPLVLRHILSGTPSDDELVPALHSRIGGAHCTLSDNDTRITNFRRGTCVWYLSKAAGAPCPFARAGIRLCDYGENGKMGAVVNPGKEKKRLRDRLRRAEQCGQKRKRLLRACADKGSDSDSDSDSADDEKRPPKVKLTLRLKPSRISCTSTSTSPSGSSHGDNSEPHESINRLRSADSDSDSMSVDSSDSEDEQPAEEEKWTLPPYPRRSISIPCYTPSFDGPYPSPPSRAFGGSGDYRRSPSVPFSVTSDSPPPNSEDEDEDFHISMTGNRRVLPGRVRETSMGVQAEDTNADSDFLPDREESETQWGESPGPRSPSIQFEDAEVTVKHEPRDVRSLLDAWEDFDITIPDMKVVDVVAQAAAGLDSSLPEPKAEDRDVWNWYEFAPAEGDGDFIPSPHEVHATKIKQEEIDLSLYDPLDSPRICESPLSPYSGYSAAASPQDTFTDNFTEVRRPSELMWNDVELLGPDSLEPRDLEDSVWHEGCGSKDSMPNSIDERADPLISSIVVVASPNLETSPCQAPSLTKSSGAEVHEDTPLESQSEPSGAYSMAPVPSDTQSISLEKEETSSDIPSPLPVMSEEAEVFADTDEIVVVHTCQPCVPAICATELEGISVYQMTLGSYLTLRRIDTDFVNISPILEFLGLEHPSLSEAHNATVVTQGSSVVCGTWVSVQTARTLITQQPLVNVFLSDSLNERFPSALQEFHRTKTQWRSLNQFGPPFHSTMEAKRESTSLFRLDLSPRSSTLPWERGMVSPWDVEDHLLSVHPPFALASAIRPAPTSEQVVEVETPLSPTEEEIFHSLCADPDWESSTSPPTSPKLKTTEHAVMETPIHDRQLRRSKMVATGVTTRSRSKRGSRNSLA